MARDRSSPTRRHWSQNPCSSSVSDVPARPCATSQSAIRSMSLDLIIGSFGYRWLECRVRHLFLQRHTATVSRRPAQAIAQQRVQALRILLAEAVERGVRVVDGTAADTGLDLL